MKKLYTEKQFVRYSDFLDKIANKSLIAENFMIHLTMNEWFEQERLTQNAIVQMDIRIANEDLNN